MFKLLKLNKKRLEESQEIEWIKLKPEVFVNEAEMRDFFAEK